VAAAGGRPGLAPLAYIPFIVAGWVVLGPALLLVIRGKVA
jgi:hypothetical protein